MVCSVQVGVRKVVAGFLVFENVYGVSMQVITSPRLSQAVESPRTFLGAARAGARFAGRTSWANGDC